MFKLKQFDWGVLVGVMLVGIIQLIGRGDQPLPETPWGLTLILLLLAGWLALLNWFFDYD